MQDRDFEDDLLFDRLVDGELSAVERRALLESLDSRPDGWRRCALRFLESQCWAEGLRQFVREPVSLSAAGANSSKAAVQNGRSQRRGVSWAAIAAGLLIAFTLGLVVRNGAPRAGAPIAGNPLPGSNGSIAQLVPPGAPDAANGDVLTLFVRDETGQTRPIRVPLLDARTLDRQLGLEFQSGVPDEVRNRLEDSGFDIQSKRSYAPLWLEDGRPMFVPVEDTKIVPVRQNVY
jgi:hypothetical protein